MRIGIDISEMHHKFYGGSNTYSFNLIEGFSKIKIIKVQVYVSSDFLRERKLKNFDNVTFIEIKNKWYEIILKKILNKLCGFSPKFLQTFFLKIDYYLRDISNISFKKKVENYSDLLISPDATMRTYKLKIPTYTNLCDLLHIHYPEFFSIYDINLRGLRYLNSAKYSTELVSHLDYNKEEFLNHFNFLPPSKIHTIYPGVKIELNNSNDYLKKNNFFFPAQFWKHKNHELVLQAFKKYYSISKLKRKLILCGEYDQIKNKYVLNEISNLKEHIINLGVINIKDKIQNYKKSFCTICPALYEASALPMKEAFVYKSLVILSDIPSHLEESKDFKVMYFKKDSSDDLTKKLLFLDELTNNERICEYNYDQVQSYSLKEQAKKWIDLFKS